MSKNSPHAGDLVLVKCWLGPGHKEAGRETGLVVETTNANVYEPAEARVYFGHKEKFEWLPLRSLSLPPDEER